MEGVKVEVSGVTVLESELREGLLLPKGVQAQGMRRLERRPGPGGGREGRRQRRFPSGCHKPGAGCGITVAAA